MPAFNLPADAVGRLRVTPGTNTPYPAAVARPPREARPAAVVGARGWVSAARAIDPGAAWPDAKGGAVVAAGLAEGGGVLLGFATLTNAMACPAWLSREAGR